MKALNNAPNVVMGVIGVSRDCFPRELTDQRLTKLMSACAKKKIDVKRIPVIIENEYDAMDAIEKCKSMGVNAVVIYLGNFGPEGPTTIFAQKFGGPVMICGAAEETGRNLIGGRGDAYCGMLNASYNVGLRNLSIYIPKMPIGTPEDLAPKIEHFISVARVVIGVKSLKVFAFGPRPHDFLACNAPIKGLYDMGVEVMENSELDLLDIFNQAKGHKDIPAIVKDMTKELGKGNTYPDLLARLAQFEVALTGFMEKNLGASQFAAFANKCWPSYEKFFHCVPCYVNSRLATRGIPVACEVDIYGAVSEYIGYCASSAPATLLDINNSVPADMTASIKDKKGAAGVDLFMGFHCGNTPSCCMKNCSMKFQLIMNRLMEDPKKKPDITRGTLEGQLLPGPTTVLRVQSAAGGGLSAYVADGSILDVDPKSFGAIGIFAIKDFARFYRYALIGGRFPHHGAIAFEKVGQIAYDSMQLLGIKTIHTPKPAGILYDGENPFEGM